MLSWFRSAVVSLCVGVGVGVVACAGGGAPALGDPADAEPAAAGGAAVILAETESAAGTVHIVRMVARGDQYAFEPAELTARSGDVVRFVHTGYQPESVGFDAEVASAEAAAFIRERGLGTGPLLTEPGTFFDVELQDAPPGEYAFHSVPHRERGMVGRVVVGEGR